MTAQGPDHVILFTGHRIDSPARAQPRFPAACEGKAREAIGSAVRRIRDSAPGPVVGVAGAAGGGDILFLEVCGELGIATQVCLALPRDRYIAESVAPEWVERFDRVVEQGRVTVLAEEEAGGSTVWERNNLWELRTALSFGGRRLTLIALWDRKTGDGPGGTEHMVGLARERGAEIEILDIGRICDSGES